MPGVTPTNASRETDQSVKDVLEVVCETENERDSNCRPKGEKKDNEIKKNLNWVRCAEAVQQTIQRLTRPG